MTVDRSKRPAASDPRPLRLPAFAASTLGSGLGVEFARRASIPEVSLRLVLEAGACHELPAKRGLAALTARLLTEGTEDRDALSMARWLDQLGASYAASAGYGTCMISMHFLSEVLEDALEFLAATIAGPTFPQSDFERIRDERLDQIERQGDDPAIVADHALIQELYAEDLYGRPIGGTRDSVTAIDRADVASFHASRFGGDGSLLVVCGDVDEQRFLDSAEVHFADWNGGGGRGAPPASPEPKGGEVILIDRAGSPQAEIRVATLGVPYGTSDHHAIIVANAILGGLFNSRINMNLREDKGWTYGARTSFGFRRGPGPFVARTAVETGVTADAFGEILGEIDTMRNELVTSEELELAQHALTLSLPLQFEGAVQIAAKVARGRIYDLPGDYWEVYRDRIEAVTPDEVREVCRRYLPQERLTLLAVTDATTAREGLERFGSLDVRSNS